MSVNIEKRTVDPGHDDFVEEVWELKERIRQDEGVLKQRRGFFVDAYRRSTTHLLVTNESAEQVVAFASVRRDGYILFLAVDPDYRGQGFGEKLIADIVERNRTVTCHARTTNENAVQFYEHLGFEVKRHIQNYYEDAGDAYYLKLGEGDGISDRLSEFIHG